MPLFEAPVGPKHERNAGVLWPTAWRDSNKYEALYEVRKGVWANHTGADLNLKMGEDNNAPVYAMGDGTVTFARRFRDPKVWGGLIVIYHGVVDNNLLYSRYGHVQGIDPSLAKGTKVVKGQQIAQIGGAELGFNPHLHFDISTTSVLDGEDSAAGFWPGTDLNLLGKNFVNPLEWLNAHKHMSTDSNTAEYLVTHPDGAQVRKDHSLSAQVQVVQVLKQGSKLTLKKAGQGNQEGFTWGQISGGDFDGCWVALCKADESEFYLSEQKPS